MQQAAAAGNQFNQPWNPNSMDNGFGMGPGAGANDGVKQRLMNLIHAVRTLMRSKMMNFENIHGKISLFIQFRSSFDFCEFNCDCLRTGGWLMISARIKIADCVEIL